MTPFQNINVIKSIDSRDRDYLTFKNEGNIILLYKGG